MTLATIFKRMRREWRLLMILLFAISLITGFFALGPLYIRSVTEVDLRTALVSADEDALRITITRENELGNEELEEVRDELGGLVNSLDVYKRADYTAPIPPPGQAPGIVGTAVCGFNFALGVDPLQGVGGTPNCYQPFAFNTEDLARRVTVVQGRLPERGPTPEMLEPANWNAEGNDELQQELQLGFYNRGEVEAVVTRTVAEEADLEVGSRFFIGYIIAQGQGALTRVKIVGIVDINDINDSFWFGNNMFTRGASISINNLGQTRFDYGLAFHPAAYEDWIVPVLPQTPRQVNTNYIWRMGIDTSVIDTTNADQYSQAIDRLQSNICGPNDGSCVTTGLTAILGDYEERVGEAEGPIIFLSGAILILMLYHLITTVGLILQQQGKEWSTITSRGGSSVQLFKLQSVTILVLALIAFALGPILSRGFMYLMEYFGPLADALDGVDIGNVPIPPRSIWLSLGAAVACVIVLSLPAVPAAQQSLLLLKQATSRPPTRPAWTKYWLDIVLIVVGFAFILRLYMTIDGDIGLLTNDLIAAPGNVIDLVANNATESGGLKDPFNLLAPALVLTGFALLWLRFFPILAGLISRITSRSNKLTTPLAIWNVERDPNHYAQLVLLLIGTLALGTASLGLQATRDKGGWEAAVEETGGAARVELNLSQGILADEIPWSSFDGVTGATGLLVQNASPVQEANSQGIVNIIGLNPQEFADTFPEYASRVEALSNVTDIERSGIVLREDASQLQVQVWSESIADEGIPEATVILRAYLQDANGVPFRMTLEQPQIASVSDGGIVVDTGLQPTLPDRWITLSGNMPISGVAPYRLWRVGFATQQGDVNSFSHTVYMDFWQTVDADGTATPIENQENLDLWAEAIAERPYPGTWESLNIERRQIIGIENLELVDASVDAPVFDGEFAMRVDYTISPIRNAVTEPSIGINMHEVARIPVIVSDDFALAYRPRNSNLTDPLQVGDQRDIQLNTGVGTVNLGLNVVDVIEDFPTLDESVRENAFIIMPVNSSRLLLNQVLLNRAEASVGNFTNVNQVWFEIVDRKPSATFEAELDQIEAISASRFAWDRFLEIQREPLPSAVAGMLYAGFWVSLSLSLLDFAFYIAVTAKQRSFTFGVLRSLGWNSGNIWKLLLIEQITLVTPALIIGSVIGVGLAYLLLPFLVLVGSSTLQLPILKLLLLIAAMIGGFTFLLILTALWLRRMSVNQVLRLGEE